MHSSISNGYVARRPATLAIVKLLLLCVSQLSFVRAAPFLAPIFKAQEDDAKPADDPSLWLYLGVAAALVLLGGAFAGLTIALMGQDEIYLQVIKTSGEGVEKKHAAKVLRLLSRGKHWVLVTLLLGNVITNETLPIILDRSLGGGWPAVLGSTVLIVIFGEIAPQSICVRYGLPIGAWMSPFVLGLMFILSPVAWPTAKLLDYLLGQGHGTTYKKAGLKTLVTLHKTLGAAGEQLNSDEVTIISAVLDLKDKPVGNIMTPMDDVFTMSADTVLDEETMNEILSQGYSRIPIHAPDNEQNFVGMLLVKMLITYDPEDAKPVRDFALATLPETRADTSCLDIVNFFQEGKSHMVLVSEYPGEDFGALGVVTLEDVIEELIGEEIIDESDVFIDVHKAIRRMAPAPRTRVPKGYIVTDPDTSEASAQEGNLIDISEDQTLSPEELQRSKTADSTIPQFPLRPKGGLAEYSTSPKTTLLPRRRSSAAGSDAGSNANANGAPIAKRGTTPEMREHFKHLGPSNRATRPRTTRYNTVKIKPGGGTSSSLNNSTTVNGTTTPRRVSGVSESASSHQGGVGAGLLSSAGKGAKDGVQALGALGYGYGSMDHHSLPRPRSKSGALQNKTMAANQDSNLTQPEEEGQQQLSQASFTQEPETIEEEDGDNHNRSGSQRRPRSSQERPDSLHSSKSRSRSTIRSLHERSRSPGYQRRGPARSGSITENIVDANGIRKVVLETTSSSSDSSGEGAVDGEGNKENRRGGSGSGSRKESKGSAGGGGSRGEPRLRGGGGSAGSGSGRAGKKKRRRRKKAGGSGKGEEDPLLGN